MSFTSRRIREDRPPSTVGTILRTLSRIPILTIIKIGAVTVGMTELAWRKHIEGGKRELRERILKRTLTILLAILLALVVLAGTVKALVALRILSLNGFLSVAGSEVPLDRHGHLNVLLLGTGDERHEGIDLTDTIMVASLDPGETKSAVLLSLPRDLYFLKTATMGEGRINSLYRDTKIRLRRTEGLPEAEASKRAMRALADEIGTVLDLQIAGAVKIDFIAFTETVDALGGIDIVVPETIVDTQYPGPNYTYQTFQIDAGPQHLDGETALKYARSRHTTSDFGRSARQQQILAALSEKAKASGLLGSPGKLLTLYRIIAENTESTFTSSELIGVARNGRDIDRSRILTMQLSDRNGLYGTVPEAGGFLYNPPREEFDGASVLLPVSIPEFPVTWRQVKVLSRLLFQNRAVRLQEPRIAVLNAGAPSGMARFVAAELIRYGYRIEHLGNAGGDKTTDSWIAPLTEADAPAAAFFASLLKLPVHPAPALRSQGEGGPAGLAPEAQQQVMIVLGKDFEYQPLQDLIAVNNSQ